MPCTVLVATELANTPPAVYGNNFSNYDSAAQRMDVLTYVQYDWTLNSDMTWSNQAYFHHDTGRGTNHATGRDAKVQIYPGYDPRRSALF